MAGDGAAVFKLTVTGAGSRLKSEFAQAASCAICTLDRKCCNDGDRFKG